MADVRWTEDMTRLFSNPLKLIPSTLDSDAERFNTLSRLILLSTAAAYAVSGSYRDLLLGGGLLGGYVVLAPGSENLDDGKTQSKPDTWSNWWPFGGGTETPVPQEIKEEVQTKPTKKEQAKALETAGESANTPPEVDEKAGFQRQRDPNIRNPDGAVWIQNNEPVSAGTGVAGLGARASYLTTKVGEPFPGAFANAERLIVGSAGCRNRTPIIPSREDFHNAYRPVPPMFDSAADQDYMSGLTGPYKRLARIA